MVGRNTLDVAIEVRILEGEFFIRLIIMNFKITKSFIISFILTVLITVASFQLWFVFKPVPVSLDIKGSGKCKINIQLNKKDNNQFMKIKMSQKDISFNDLTHETFFVKKMIKPKRFRILISNLEPLNTFTLSNITLNNNVLLNDFSKFSIDGANFKIINDSLVISPQKERIEILYDKTLNITAPIQFEPELLLIIFILSFAVSFTLVNYLKNIKKNDNSKIDIIFLTVFFIFLLIPMSYINNEEISYAENRSLAKFYPIYTKQEGVNFNFGKQFDNWYNDRFNLRRFFISVYDTKNLFNKNWKTKKVIKGKEDWLFLATRASIESYTNATPFSEEELIRINKYLTGIDDYCRKSGKLFYFVIVPDKHKIYPEYYSDLIRKVNDDSKSKAEQIVNYLNKNSNIKVIYLKDILEANKNKGYLYDKQDTHWNLLGTYYGYLGIMDLISKDIKDIYIYKPKGETKWKEQGGLNGMLPDILKNKIEFYYDVPDVSDRKAKCDVKMENCINKSQKRNLIVYGDSFTENLAYYLPESFNKTQFLRKQGKLSPFGMNEADVVILEIVERFLPAELGIYKEEE